MSVKSGPNFPRKILGDRNSQTPWGKGLRILAAIALGLLLALGTGPLLHPPGTPPVMAQFIQPEQFAPRIYERLPELPREDGYLSLETGEVAPANSLATRLIRYHLYVKNRSPRHRFDWKITLADYLGLNEPMRAELYPGATTLSANPMEKDVAIVRRFNRQQREALIDALVQTFNPEAARTTTPPPPRPTAPARPNSGNQPPALPRPGAADLLLPLQ